MAPKNPSSPSPPERHPTVASSLSSPNPHYDALGGEPAVRHLVDRFYHYMGTLPEAATIRAMHPEDLGPIKVALGRFLTEWLGGPALYSARLGQPRLRKRHLSFSIGPREAEAWMICMTRALEDTDAPPTLKQELKTAFSKSAQFLRNDPEHVHMPQGDSDSEGPIAFFEKPGCINNTRQKAWLEEAGHEIEAHNLLEHPWSEQELLSFLAPLPVADWFNRSAPTVKNGQVVPERLDRNEALELLMTTPLLIRRPLIACAGKRHVGFDVEAIHQWLGLPEHVVAQERDNNTEACPRHS